ncbi:MAG: rod shape-determining protein RodA [Candidatus Omnitrophota bacterium]|nr:MAG: rod shape-determining protein RodA [Candidatus Omnitrophota bacterium]RKY44909.1 MAG: rod shape-determining protein RodA [Candidatus Omnitrophota bacterium]
MFRKNYQIILIVLALNFMGLISLYSSLHQGGEFTGRVIFLKQILWIVLGWVLAIFISFINYRVFFDLSIWLYFISLFLLVVVAILGKIQMGAQRWLELGGLTFQPSEFAKLAGLLILSRFLNEKGREVSFLKGFFKEIIIPFFPLAFLFIAIFIQPDLGTSLILIFLFLFMLIGAGIEKKKILLFLLIIAIFLPGGWSFLRDYQKERLLVFINPNSDPLGAGYTIIQSKIAIGSGRLLGKGFLSGTQNQLNFIPARHTDFIFTVFAEEWGFLGCILLLFLYYLLLKIILDIANNLQDRFSYLICIGIFSLFFIHLFINISMVMGLLPVVGLPLLFFSYGGTYTIINFILIGILLNIIKTHSQTL